MSSTNVHVNISENQKGKIKHVVESKSPVSIRLGFDDLCGNDILALTNLQVNRMAKAFENGKGITIKMSKRQVVHKIKIEGGFLGMLAGLAAKALPVLAKTVLPTLATGALSGVGSALAQKATNKAMGNGLYLKKGSIIASVETDSQGLYLKPYRGSGLGRVGNGPYLKQGGQIIDGSGLLLSPDYPSKNIPVLGWLLWLFETYKCVNQRKFELSKTSHKTSTNTKINTSTRLLVSKTREKCNN